MEEGLTNGRDGKEEEPFFFFFFVTVRVGLLIFAWILD